MNTNVTIPKKSVLKKLIDGEPPKGTREDKQRGTNCSGEMMNYLKRERNIRIFVKKAFMKGHAEEFEEDYRTIKKHFGNIIPTQAFLQTQGDVFAFCAPISIKIDALRQENKNYLLQLLKSRPRLVKQLRFFVKKFHELKSQGQYLDLYGNENLVVSEDDRLYFLDSFFVFHKTQASLIEATENNIAYLEQLLVDFPHSTGLPPGGEPEPNEYQNTNTQQDKLLL